jgi:hypothetical protein
LTYLQHVRYPAHLRPAFNKIKQCRRVATRYDKLAANYLAFIKLAAIRIWLRAYESTPWRSIWDVTAEHLVLRTQAA